MTRTLLLTASAITALALAGCMNESKKMDTPSVSSAATPNEPVSGDPNVPTADIPGSPTGGNIPNPGVSNAAAPNEPISGDPNTAAATIQTDPTPSPTETTSTGGGYAGVSTAAGPNEPVSGDPNTAASDKCYEDGGSVIQWYDANGEAIDACRTSDGTEYSLTDYISYGG